MKECSFYGFMHTFEVLSAQWVNLDETVDEIHQFEDGPDRCREDDVLDSIPCSDQAVGKVCPAGIPGVYVWVMLAPAARWSLTVVGRIER